jgi:hypothetical protein
MDKHTHRIELLRTTGTTATIGADIAVIITLRAETN